jgi:hypothetical protein
MSKFVTAAAAASLVAFGATLALAQGTQNPNADKRPFSQDGTNNTPYDKKAEPTNKATEPGVGSRPIGPSKDETPTDPVQKNMPQPELKKLDKEGRGGQQN